MLLKTFNKVVGKVLLEANVSDWSADQVDTTKYVFKTDENGNTTCIFQIVRNADVFTVTAVMTDSETKFLISGEDGTINELSEKEFAVEYWKDYEDFKKALKQKDELPSDEADTQSDVSVDIPKIDSFKNVVDGDDEEVTEKKYVIKGHMFIIKKLQDPLMPDYCEVSFDTVDPDTKETVSNKALAICKVGKTMILKIIQFNEKGERTNIMGRSDLEKIDIELRRCLDKAIVKFSNYLSEMDL